MSSHILSPSLPLLGETIAGRYLVEREIANSALCTLYRASDLKRDRVVALRVFKPLVNPKGAETQAWSGDLEQVGRWASTQFLPTQDLGVAAEGVAAGRVYTAEPFVPQASLDERLKQGALPADEVMRLGAQLFAALDALHQAGRLHLNLKPSNVFVSENAFGLSQLVVSGVGKRAFMSFDKASTGESLATPTYLIPELVLGEAATPAADIYQAGVLLYELAVGRPPFSFQDQRQAARAHLNDNPVHPRLANPRAKLSKGLNDLLLQCLSKRPEQRPASAQEARAQLELLLGEEATSLSAPLTPLFTPSPADLS
ncbi:MAG: serine/threonine protein kinase, partial [Deltaproteobacteria bacterium]|nr:serine/threonine protein kinase [Deltaproteobacteria bacterium]